MPFQIIRNDITKVRADAIVNTANPRPRIGKGTDGAIYEAAGKDQLLAQREKIGDIAPGQAFATDAFHLNAKYIIHTVGPVWIDGTHGEREVLHSCYGNSLQLAEDLNCQSVAFPLIASGVYGFPKDEALSIALEEIGKFLLTHEINVMLVVLDRKAVQLSQQIVGGIEQYIDDHSANLLRRAEYGDDFSFKGHRIQSEWPSEFPDTASPEKPMDTGEEVPPEACESRIPPAEALPVTAGKDLEEMLGGTGLTFQQKLFELIEASGMDDVTVYKKANIDRKVFSRIRCKADYKPKKKTAVAFAIALELDLPAAQDLLSRAEIAFSPSSPFDLIITYFINNKNYDIFQINATLFKYNQPLLGGLE